MKGVFLLGLALVASALFAGAKGSCLFLYVGQPQSQICRCSDAAEWMCMVQVSPDTTSDSLSIRWYYSATDSQESGTLIEPAVGKYTFFMNFADIPDETTGLISATSELYIQNVCDDEAGYYWCQMIVDGNPLPPSDTRNLAIDSGAISCSTGANSEDKCVVEAVSPTPTPTALPSPTASPGPTMGTTDEDSGAMVGVMGGALSASVCLILGLVFIFFV